MRSLFEAEVRCPGSLMGLGNCMNFRITGVQDACGRVVGQGREEARGSFRHQITKTFMC